MKNLKSTITSLSVIGLLLISTFSANAQKAEFGVRFMPTFSNFDLQTSTGGTVNGKATIGLGFGAVLGFSFTDHAAIQVEVIYQQLSQKYTEQNIEREIKLNYVNIPLLFALNTGKTKSINFGLVLGPQIGLSVGSSIHLSVAEGTNGSHAVLSTKTTDLGFAYGAGIDFGINDAKTIRFSLGYRGVYSLIDLSDNTKSLTNNDYYVVNRTHIKTNAGYVGISFLF